MSTPPKEVYVRMQDITHVSRIKIHDSTPRFRYVLAPEHTPPKRKAIAYVVKYRGNYLYELPSAWTAQLACAIRYAPHDKQGAEMRAKGLNARVVAVVRKEIR